MLFEIREELGMATQLQPRPAEGELTAFKIDDDQLGYRAVNFWPEATPENAQIVPINAAVQDVAEEILWSLRQRRTEPSRK